MSKRITTNDHTRLLADGWTDEAEELCREVRAVLKPVIEKYHDAGYNSYDIQLIIMEEVSIEVTGERLMRKHGHKRRAVDKA